VFILGLSLGDRELFRIGQNYVERTGNLSPLMMAGLFYLAITVPLTHLVNVLDKRLREGKAVTAEELPATVDAPRRA
jgi:polar amino acid transport system permease protein